MNQIILTKLIHQHETKYKPKCHFSGTKRSRPDLTYFPVIVGKKRYKPDKKYCHNSFLFMESYFARMILKAVANKYLLGIIYYYKYIIIGNKYVLLPVKIFNWS